MNRENRTTIIGFLFVLSGLLGLVYQVVWFKYLSSFLGNTTYAQSIVLATFMGGMAIGASLWGAMADRVASPLRVYGWLEVGIGIFCVFYPLLLSFLRAGFISSLTTLGWTGETTGVLFAKLIVSALTLLPPAILMGGTLPVLVRAVADRLSRAGTIVATLYALNSFGAVVGTILGGFFFVRLIGLQNTIVVSAIASLAIGVVALLLSRPDQESGEAASPDEASAHIFTAREGKTATIIAGLSGCAAMILEVTWVRMLVPVLGSSTYSFSLMLVAFISGITLGGLYIARVIGRSKNLFGWLLVAQAGIVITIAGTLPLYERMPYVFWMASTLLARSETSYPVFLTMQFAFGFIWMFIPTFFFGISLPVAIRIASRSAATLGASVGRVYTVNTLGTVVGSLLAGFVLIPALGLSGSIVVAMMLTAAGAGIAVATLGATLSQNVRWGTVAGLAGAFAVALLFSSDTRIPSLSGVFRLVNKDRPPPESFGEFVGRYIPSTILYYKEGVTATVGVVETETAEGKERVLMINGKSDASSVRDLPTQLLLGHLPAVLHGNPKTALIIGYGSGVTAGGLLRHDIDRVECVEISPEVVEASKYFEHVNGRPMEDGRFHLVVDDASTYVSVTQTKYDLIVSEPSNPWIAGIGSLYTKEFFEECRARMSPGGIMSQWFHLYEIDDETFQLVVRTFASVFPHVTVWESMSADVLLLGSERPLAGDPASLRAVMDKPAVAAEFARIGISDPLTLLSLQIMSNRNVRAYSGDGLLNTEDRLALEYLAPRAFFVNRGVMGLDDIDERFRHPSPDTYLMRAVSEDPLTDGQKRTLGLFHSRYQRGHPLLGFFLLEDYITRHPADEEVLVSLIGVTSGLSKPEARVAYLGKLAQARPEDPRTLAEYGWALFELGQKSGSALGTVSVEAAVTSIRHAISLSGDTVDAYRVRLADMFYATGRFALAMDQYARALEIREIHEPDPYIPQDQLLTRLALCLYETGQRSRALGYALQAVNFNPANEQARSLIVSLWNEGTETSSEESGQP